MCFCIYSILETEANNFLASSILIENGMDPMPMYELSLNQHPTWAATSAHSFTGPYQHDLLTTAEETTFPPFPPAYSYPSWQMCGIASNQTMAASSMAQPLVPGMQSMVQYDSYTSPVSSPSSCESNHAPLEAEEIVCPDALIATARSHHSYCGIYGMQAIAGYECGQNLIHMEDQQCNIGPQVPKGVKMPQSK